MLLDNGYSNVAELRGGYTAWEVLNNPVVNNVTLPDGVITKIIHPFTLTGDAVHGTPIPNGSVITHWVNGSTEVISDGKRIVLAKDSEVPLVTMGSVTSKPATWVYIMPKGVVVPPAGNDKNITKMMLDGKLILTVIESPDAFKE